MTIEAYPLSWPAGWRRQPDPLPSKFKTTLIDARYGLVRQLELLGATDIIISSNAELSRTGDILARQRRIDDTGVAAYFRLDQAQLSIPCDKWVRLEDNLHAIELTVEALRGLERWGAKDMVSAAFAGFAALPETTGRAWWDVLGLYPEATPPEIETAYRLRLKVAHPDSGGSTEAFHELQQAYQQAKEARS